MAEGTSLLRMHTAYTCIVGSNPTVSAKKYKNGLPCGRPFFLFLDGVGGLRRPALTRAGHSESPICRRAAAGRLRRRLCRLPPCGSLARRRRAALPWPNFPFAQIPIRTIQQSM